MGTPATAHSILPSVSHCDHRRDSDCPGLRGKRSRDLPAITGIFAVGMSRVAAYEQWLQKLSAWQRAT